MLFERQQYQENCVSNIMRVLHDTHGVRNFSPEALRAVQREQAIQPTKITANRRLDVLMETGTGKTFTYLKTMYELNKQYGINKFVVFVPRVAIRAVVMQNIDLTADYFFQEYGKRIKKHTYGDKGGLSQVYDYIRNDGDFSVLILTSASITGRNESDRILTSRSENLLYGQKSPLDAIGGLKPVVFIDEPHLLKGEGFLNVYRQYFSNTLCLRFGATFPAGTGSSAISNVVYTLDSITSFREYLVKKIRVSTIIDEDSDIKFYPVPGTRKSVEICYFQNNIEYRRTVNCGKNIAAITDNAKYDFSILRIAGEKIFLSNNTTRNFSKHSYTLTDDPIRRMVRATIAMHFAKEEKLFQRNIKTLSLFFIPSINDFRGEDARVKTIFDEEYVARRNAVLSQTSNPAYRDYLKKDYDSEGRLCVREGYFSGDRGNSAKKEWDAVNTILNNKSKLLSIAEPLRFIFSVWALQEGWDNPNVFTICKLASTDQETSRRQQVGRGLRLAVNHEGKRQTLKHCGDHEDGFYKINMLDVVVSGHEKNFIEEIQKEIIGDHLTHKQLTNAALGKLKLNVSQISRLTNFLEDNNIIRVSKEDDQLWEIISPVADFLEANKSNLHPSLIDVGDALIDAFRKAMTSPVENRNKQTDMVGIRAAKFREFEELWKTITQKAKIIYQNINDASLINEVKTAFDQETIHPIQIKIIQQTYHHKDNRIETKESTAGDVQFFQTRSYAKFITDFASNENLPLPFCQKMFNALAKDKMKNNPGKASKLLTKIFKDTLHKTIVQGIGYQFDSEIAIDSRSVFYEDADCQTPKTEIAANKLGVYSDDSDTPQNYLYDKMVFDSTIEQTAISGDPSAVDSSKIVVFAKLPRISIPTPYKSYSPDFAYFVQNQNGKKLFLIVETKGYNSKADIPEDEKRKIAYAERFFNALNVQMKSVDVVFKQRINQESLENLLHNIGNPQND